MRREAIDGEGAGRDVVAEEAAPRRRSLGRLLGITLPSLAVAGGMGALGYLRYRYQHRKLFAADRYPEGDWDPAALGLRVQDRRFAASDGVDLHGWWIPHPEPCATILYCHGSTGSIARQGAMLVFLHRLAVDILAFDYRGYGKSGGEPSEAGLFRDVRAAWDHLVDPLDRRPGEILLFGQSLGGAVAIDCALDRPAAGLVVQASFPDVRQATRASYPNLPLHWVARNQFRSLDKVGALTLPKLFVHGGRDVRIPLALGRRLFESAAEPKEFYLVPRGGHHDLAERGGLRYLRRLDRFRRRCLEGPPAGPVPPRAAE